MSRAKRRKSFVDAKVQGALARRIIFHWLVFLCVATTVSLLLQVLSNPFRPTSEHLHEMWWTHGPFLIVMLFLLPVFVVDTIKLSHRFAGPIGSLQRAMREVAKGQPPRELHFRSNDFWHDLANDYNGLLTRLAPHKDRSDSLSEAEEETSMPAID